MDGVLSRRAASAAVADQGWRFLLGTLRTSVPVGSVGAAADVVARAVAACGVDADGHLRADVRTDRVVLILQSVERAAVTGRDVDMARRISGELRAVGMTTEPGAVQVVEIAVDALDVPAVRAFWAAVLGYAGDGGAIADPAGQGPALWFQQMDRPRAQRNRIHLDVCVPHDQAEARVAAALAAGGRLVSAQRAPAFWVLADVEGNEACVTTWQGRD